ncbi:Crp/Fnr family transcriptional regulator [Flavobacterium sp.]|uniref:Crp/Fnr family transcriptional regulator n=1 Tax=Flavobacterium sp. TaxID=239 RepID=UPI003D11D1E2
MSAILEKYLRNLKYMSADDIDRGLAFFKPLVLKKGDYFIKENQVCTTVAFLLKGSVKAFTTDLEGNQKIICFGFENNFITVLDSFQYQKPSLKNIQATENCELVWISKTELELLLAIAPTWQILAHQITTQEYLEKERYLYLFQNQLVEFKFQNLITHYPQIYKRIKLEDQASFIGTTIRSFNRAKKNYFQKQIGQLS